MMKHFRYILAAAVFLGGGTRLTAADTNIAQRLNFTLIGTYEETVTNAVFSRSNIVVTSTSTNRLPYSTATNHTIKTVLINAPNVVRAIAIDLDKFRGAVGSDTNLVNGVLYRKVDVNTGAESIVLRKAHAGTNVEVDVTSFFGGSSAIANDFNTTNEIATTVQTTGGLKTNLTASINSISFTSTNMQFSVTNAYGTSFLASFGASRVKNIMASGAGTFFVNIATPLSSTNNPGVTTNFTVVTNYTLASAGPTNVYNISSVVTNINTGVTNVAGPAHGTFSSTLGAIIK